MTPQAPARPILTEENDLARLRRRGAEARRFVAEMDPSLLDTSGIDLTLHDLLSLERCWTVWTMRTATSWEMTGSGSNKLRAHPSVADIGALTRLLLERGINKVVVAELLALLDRKLRT